MKTATKISAIERLKAEKHLITSVYSGKVKECCCGCKGNHTDASESPQTVTTIVNKLIKALESAMAEGREHDVFIEPDLISADTETRTYIAYFN